MDKIAYKFLIGIGICLLMSCGSPTESHEQSPSGEANSASALDLSTNPRFNIQENSWEFKPSAEAYVGGQIYVPDSLLKKGELLLETHHPALVFRLELSDFVEKADQWQDVALDWNLYAGRCYAVSPDRDTLTLLPQDYVDVGISMIRFSEGVQSRIDTLSWKNEGMMKRERLLIVTPTQPLPAAHHFAHFLPDRLYNLGLFTHIQLIQPTQQGLPESIMAARPDALLWMAPPSCSELSDRMQQVFCTENPELDLLIQQMQASKLPVILGTPNAISSRLASQASVRSAEQRAQAIRELANRYSLAIIDVWSSFDTYQGEIGYEMEELLEADGIHPNAVGHQRIAGDVAATLEYVYLYQ